jgi:hypothetical protein
MSKFGHEKLKVVYKDGVPEFHATEDRQARDEDLNWALYHPMLALFIIANPARETVAREPEIDDDYINEMKDILGEAGELGAEFFRLREQLDIEQNPTRQAALFPVTLLFMDGEGMATGPDGHSGLEFLKAELGGRETVTVGEIEAIAEEFKSRPK